MGLINKATTGLINKALVITPTIGSKHLIDCIESVINQSIDTHHLIVVDGSEHWGSFEDQWRIITDRYDTRRIEICQLPFNVGANGFYGHRVYAAFAHLHNFEYTLFLDEDNWFKPNHVESLILTIKKYEYEFAYSYRSIFSKEKRFLCVDECESLGLIPSIGGYHLVDTSAYCFKTSFLKKVAHLWHKGWGADRDFFQSMMNIKSIQGKFGTSGRYSLCYRLDGNPNSVKAEFFEQGNQIAKRT